MSYESDDKMVSHPDHYNSGKFEVIDIIEEFTKDLSGIEAVDTGNAIKYVLRWHKKNGIQDIKKAIWYLTHLLEHLEEKAKKPKEYDGPDEHCKTCMFRFETPENDEICKNCFGWENYKPDTIFVPCTDETVAKDFIEDVSKVEDQLDEKEIRHCGTCKLQYSLTMCPRLKAGLGASLCCSNLAVACTKWTPVIDMKNVDKEESELSVECHTNAAGVTVPDSQPWSSSSEPHNCITCVYRLRKSNLEPCKSCEKYINWTPKEQEE